MRPPVYLVAEITDDQIARCPHDKESITIEFEISMRTTVHKSWSGEDRIPACAPERGLCGNYVSHKLSLLNPACGRILLEKAQMSGQIRQFWHDEQGQDLIEYTLLLAFVALSSAALFTRAGSSVHTVWSAASTSLGNAALAATS